jgi:hypothetical protein
MSGKIAPAVAVRIGVGLEMLGVIGVALLANTTNGWGPLAPCLFIYGVGVGLATAQLTGVIMVDVPMNQIGQASGSQSTVRQIGSALGIAVLGTVLFTQVQSSLLSKLTDLGMPAEGADVYTSASKFTNSVVDSAGGVIPGYAFDPKINPAYIQAAKDAFTVGASWAALSAALFLALGFLATFRLSQHQHGEKAKH